MDCMPPVSLPLYKCPFCKALFYDRETAKSHIKEKHYSQMTKQAASTASFFNRSSYATKGPSE